jgi:hypothetical protein
MYFDSITPPEAKNVNGKRDIEQKQGNGTVTSLYFSMKICFQMKLQD